MAMVRLDPSNPVAPPASVIDQFIDINNIYIDMLCAEFAADLELRKVIARVCTAMLGDELRRPRRAWSIERLNTRIESYRAYLREKAAAGTLNAPLNLPQRAQA